MLVPPVTTTMPESLVLYSQADARDRLLDDDVTSVTAAQFEASFRVTGKLGYGAYSDVYSCVHQGTAKALKVLRPGSGLGSGGCLPEVAFFREARALKHLHHESIVSFKGLLHIPPGVASIGDPRVSHWAIVQELLQGGTLRGVIYKQMVQHRHCYTFTQALEWALDIADAIRCCHTSNPMVIHRDLKLENILLTKQGKAKLSDFGLHVMVKPLPSHLVVTTNPFGRVSLSLERSKDSAATINASQSSSAASATHAMPDAGAATATTERVAAAGVAMGDSADSLQGCVSGMGGQAGAKAAPEKPNTQDGLQGREEGQGGRGTVDGVPRGCEPGAVSSHPIGDAGANSTACGPSQGVFKRLSDNAPSEASASIPTPKRRTSLTMHALRRLSVDAPSRELCQLELSNAGGGLLKVRVPLESVPASPLDDALAQAASAQDAAEAAAPAAGLGGASSGAAAAMEVLDNSGSSSFVHSCLQQANTEPDYEVSLADAGSVYSMAPGSIAGSVRSVSAAGGGALVPCSAASDVWEDIHDGDDSCLDAEAQQWPAELHFHMTTRTGSFMYMAPEVYLSRAYNEKVDIFAFGCMLYELVARVLLLFTETAANSPDDCQAYAAKVAEGYRPKRPKTFPADVWEVVEACWAQQPGMRPTSEQLVERLRQILAAAERQKGGRSHKQRAAAPAATAKGGPVEVGACGSDVQEGGQERAAATCGGCIIS